jgi:hypothetical protein
MFFAIKEASGKKDCDLLLANVECFEMEIRAAESRLEAILKTG